MDKLLFWLGIGAAQKGAGSKEVKPSRHPVIAFVVGILIAVLIAAGAFVGQPAMRFIQQLKNWSVPAQGVVISCVSRCPRSWVDCPAWGSGS